MTGEQLKRWGQRWSAFKRRTSTPPVEDQVDRLLDEHLATTYDPMVDLPPEEFRTKWYGLKGQEPCSDYNDDGDEPDGADSTQQDGDAE